MKPAPFDYVAPKSVAEACTIVLLAPSINPDGLDLVTQWYRKTLGTAHVGTSPPVLYQMYVGHDNNRDWYIFRRLRTVRW